MLLPQKEKVVCPNEDFRKGTLQFPLDASCVTEPETEWNHNALLLFAKGGQSWDRGQMRTGLR